MSLKQLQVSQEDFPGWFKELRNEFSQVYVIYLQTFPG